LKTLCELLNQTIKSNIFTLIPNHYYNILWTVKGKGKGKVVPVP